MSTKKHTFFTLWVKPVGESSYKIEHRLENKLFSSADEIDQWLQWGFEGNWIIQLHQDQSQFGMLDNWRVLKTSIKNLSDCDLGAVRALEMLKIIDKNKRKKRLEKTRTAHAQRKSVDGNTTTYWSEEIQITEMNYLYNHNNFWIDPDGKFHAVSPPGAPGKSHNEWAWDWLDSNGYDRQLEDDDRYFYEILKSEDFGFVRVLSWGSEGYVFDCDKTPNGLQWQSIRDLCVIKKIDVPKWGKNGFES